jgi:hypothetical protein
VNIYNEFSYVFENIISMSLSQHVYQHCVRPMGLEDNTFIDMNSIDNNK